MYSCYNVEAMEKSHLGNHA